MGRRREIRSIGLWAPQAHLGWDFTSHCVITTEWGAWKGERESGQRWSKSGCPAQQLMEPWPGPTGTELHKPALMLLKYPSDPAMSQDSLRNRFKSLWALKRRQKVHSFVGVNAEGIFHCSLAFMIRYWSEVCWDHLKDWVYCSWSRLQSNILKTLSILPLTTKH